LKRKSRLRRTVGFGKSSGAPWNANNQTSVQERFRHGYETSMLSHRLTLMAADLFRSGVRDLITGPQGFERTVMFAFDEAPATISPRERRRLTTSISGPAIRERLA